MRKSKKGKKRPEITGQLHPIYGITNKRNPFFGKKHLKENIQKISDAGKLKIGLKNSRASPVMIQEIESGKYSIFATKIEAANFLGITKANTVTQYIKKDQIFQNKWLCLSITREKYNKILQDKNSFEI